METLPRSENSALGTTGQKDGHQVVYVMPKEAFAVRSDDDDIDIAAAWRSLWDGRWLVVGITAIFATFSVAYALIATEWYQADVLLIQAEERQVHGLTAQFGGLASLAGISVGGGSTAEPIAVLTSREFAREFIEDHDLLTVLLFNQWDADAEKWHGHNPDNWPDIRDAVVFFDEKVRSVREDSKTGLVRLSVRWTDPEVAASWANELVERVNSRMRQRALADAKANVSYLQTELAATSIVTLQESIGRLLESEMQKMMLARGNEEFAFRVIDPANAPKERVWPRRTLVAVAGTLAGSLLGVMVVLARSFVRLTPKGRSASGI